MPELPEIETIKNGISPCIKNKNITKIIIRNHNLRWPITKNLPPKLANKKILAVTRRGKYLIFQFDTGSLLIHLGMSGTLAIVKQETPITKHDHVDICLTDNYCLRFNDPRRFGCIIWTDNNPLQHKLLKHLGIEPLTQEFTGNFLFTLTQKSNRPIKLLIMDANLIVGVGNIYANEALFMAKIHPATIAKNLTKQQCNTLVKTIKKVLTQAIKAGGTSFKDYRKADGNLGYFQQQLQVYGRQNQACKQCGKTLQSLRMGQRITVFCPSCQHLHSSVRIGD